MSLRVFIDTTRGERCRFHFNGTSVDAYQGETIAAALLASGRRALRQDSTGGSRSLYCNMGTCFECVVEIEEHVNAALKWTLARACLSFVREGLQVRSLSILQTGQQP